MGLPYHTSSPPHRYCGGRYISLWIGGFVLISGLQIGCATTERLGNAENLERSFQTQAHVGTTVHINTPGHMSSLSAPRRGFGKLPSTPQWVTKLLKESSVP